MSEAQHPLLVANRCVAHPWECDVMGHLTTRYIIGMFDDASYHFLHAVFGLSPGANDAGGLGWADVRMVIDYSAEVAAGDLLEVRARLMKLGTKSVTVEYVLHNLTRDELAATLEVVTVLFDLNERRAVAFSDALRERAAGWLASDA